MAGKGFTDEALGFRVKVLASPAILEYGAGHSAGDGAKEEEK
jgi:hypothetical protein